MSKFFFRTFLLLILLIILLTSYLSIFGIKTDKFNEIIKSQIIKKDDRLDLNIKDVFLKLNIREKSFSINSKNLEIFILKESQKIKNLDILIDIESIIKREDKIKKILINSEENKIDTLLKFIKAYKINIPVLYLENSITKGNIIYNITINSNNGDLNQAEITGKIIDAKLNILEKEEIDNINFNFEYKNKIKFVYLKEPNTIGENVVGFINKLPEEFNLHSYVDYDTIFQKAFIEPITSIIDSVGWKTEPQATLEDLFA